MKELKDRIYEVMEELGFKTQQELGKFLGVSKTLVGQWIKGDTGLGKKPLLEFEKKTNFSSRWLVDGTGPKYREPQEARFSAFASRLQHAITEKQIELSDLAKKACVSENKIKEYLSGEYRPQVEDSENLANALDIEVTWLRFGDNGNVPPIGSGVVISDNPPENTHFKIPRYEISLSAGNGNAIWVEKENDDNPLWFRHGWLKAKGLRQENLKALYVRGNSMEPVLNNWDTVVIDVSDIEAADGDIYAVFFKDKLFIKQIKHTEYGLDLISFNTSYKTMPVNEENANRVQILGRMVWRGG